MCISWLDIAIIHAFSLPLAIMLHSDKAEGSSKAATELDDWSDYQCIIIRTAV